MFLPTLTIHQDEDVVRSLREFAPHAIIASLDTSKLRAMVARFGVPTVELLFQIDHVAAYPGVSLDDEGIGRLAAEHFLDRGFDRFAIFGDLHFHWSVHRAAGLKKALATPRSTIKSNRPAAQIVATFEQAYTASSQVIAQWLGTLPRPVAVFATTDSFAARLLDIARAEGIPVPDGLAVLGVDDDEFLCIFSTPPLSSVQTGLELLGATAVSLLDRMLAGEAVACETIVVPPRGIVTRRSTDMLAIGDAEVVAALKFIRQRRDTRITVDDVAHDAALSRRALERRFTQVTGRSILDEIHRARADRIKELLQTDLSQEQIAHLCDFSSAQRMVQMFKSITGITPSEYRRLQGKM